MSIYESLYSWQRNLVDRYIDRKSYGLFLDMGLGKTPISLAFAEQNNCTKIIIITINAKTQEDETVEGSWANWIAKSSIDYVIHHKKGEYSRQQNDALIINYESLFERTKNTGVVIKENILEFMRSCVHHNLAIIVDECHKMKDTQSKQTKAIQKLKTLGYSYADDVRCYLLTGTPFTHGYIDLYSQLKFLGYKENKGDFIDQFCIRGHLPGLLGWQQPIVGYKNVDSLFKLLHTYAVTLESSDVVDLPEQIFVKHKLPETEEFSMFVTPLVSGEKIAKYAKRQKIELTDSRYGTKTKVNNPFYRDIDYRPNEQSRWLADTAGVFWMRARQLSIGFNGNTDDSTWFNNERLDAFKKFMIENEDNYLIFYNYTPELLELYAICDELGYNIDVYCGDIKSLTFYERYSAMSDDEKLGSKKNVIIANFASGSTGLNWQNYSKCIIFSLPVYKDWAQGLKRIHRLGQNKTTFYHVFYQDNWLDEGMYEALEQQIDYSEKMFESELRKIQK